MNKLFILLIAGSFFASAQISVAEASSKKKSYSISKKAKHKKARIKKHKKTQYKKHKKFRQSLRVTATAYNSLRSQTDSTPNIAAWGDRLRPGMRVIAVSRDLLRRSGLKHNTLVRIKGYPGTYRVKDKMNRRFQRRIDVYMGKNVKKARRWGHRKVVIQW